MICQYQPITSINQYIDRSVINVVKLKVLYLPLRCAVTEDSMKTLQSSTRTRTSVPGPQDLSTRTSVPVPQMCTHTCVIVLGDVTVSVGSYLVPQVVVLVSVLQWSGPVLLPLLHLPVEHVHGAPARYRQPSAGLTPRPGRESAAGGREPAPGTWRGGRSGSGGPQPVQDGPAHSGAHGAAASGPKSKNQLWIKAEPLHTWQQNPTCFLSSTAMTSEDSRGENTELDSDWFSGNYGTGLKH